jgi:anti-sigma-K factor RskA
MNEHPQDLLPAFALGVLDADEAGQVMQHVAVCAACRADVESFGAVVGLLPYSAAPQEPSALVKRRIFALIDASSQAQQADQASARGRRPRIGRWMAVVAACSLALAVIFGMLVADQRGQMDTLTAQLGEREQALQQMRGQFEQERQQLVAQLAQRDRKIEEIDNQLGLREKTIQEANRLVDERERTIEQMRTQLERERQEMTFVSNAVGQTLTPTQAGAQGKMFMSPGSTHAVLFVSGLQQPEAGKVYQFWFATPDQQVPSQTFIVGPDGAATLAIEAPAAVDGYDQVMVTVEPAPGSQRPSSEVVLEATL